jgi:hypothetical protein
MACTLTIDQILGITNAAGAIVRLTVRGTSSCKTVRVTLDKETPAPTITLGPVEVDVDPALNWEVEFLIDEHFKEGDFACGNAKVVVDVVCVDDEECANSESFDQIPCQPEGGGGACPVFGTPVVTPGDCDEQGRRVVTLSVPVTSAPAGTTLMWNYGDPAQPFPVPFNFVQSPVTTQYPYYPPGPYSAQLVVASGPNCAPAGMTVDGLAPCDEQPCATSIVLSVTNVATGALVNTQQCLPPGNYRVRVTEPADPDAAFSWSVNGVLENGATASSFDVNVTAQSPAQTIAVALDPGNPNCGILPASVTLTPCPPPLLCPTGVLVTVVNTARPNEPVDTADCLPPGTYTIRVTSPTGADLQFSWSVDGELVSSGAANTFNLTLADDGQTHQVSVTVTRTGCPPVSRAVTLESCACTGSVSLTVRNAQGNVVNTQRCVAPGNYTVTAEGDNLDESDRSWTVNGTPAGDGTVIPVTLQAASACGGGAGQTTVAVRAAKDGCPDQSAAVALQLCPEFVLCPPCWLLRLLIVFFVVVAGIALAIWLCPAVLANPLIPATAGWPAVGLAVAPFVLAAALIIAVILLLIWIWLCPLTWCFDWLPLIWQILLGVGFAFVFFGTCPACAGSLLPIGAVIFLLGVGVFIFWLLTCRPTTCTVLFELGSLGIVQLFISFLEGPLGICIILWGWLLLLIWNGILNGVGWIGGVLAGCIRRN